MLELWNNKGELPVWCPILAIFRKLPRESQRCCSNGEKLLICWKEITLPQRQQTWKMNNMKHENYTETSVSRWNRHQQPKCISQCNDHKTGSDLHDLHDSQYHISMSSKKWWPIPAWSMNSALVNGHLLQKCCWKDHQLALLLTNSLTVSFANVWNKTTKSWKEISTYCYHWDY